MRVECICLHVYKVQVQYIHVHVLMRDKKEGRKQGQTNRKAKQYSTPKVVTFLENKNELPRVGLEPTTLYTLNRALNLPLHVCIHVYGQPDCTPLKQGGASVGKWAESPHSPQDEWHCRSGWPKQENAEVSRVTLHAASGSSRDDATPQGEKSVERY